MKLQKIFESEDSQIETEEGTILGMRTRQFADMDWGGPEVIVRNMKTSSLIFKISGFDDITSLKHTPRTLEGDFILFSLKNLENLHGGPHEVLGSYEIVNCAKIKNLVGCPKSVYDFEVRGCSSLKTLSGCPSEVSKDFSVSGCNALDDFSDLPYHVGRFLSLSSNKITNLHNIHKKVKHIGSSLEIYSNKIKDSILGVMLIERIKNC
jgi:hypothetical protein